MHDGLGPFKGMGLGIMSLDKAIDGLTQLPHRSKAGPPQRTATENAEPALHLIEPTGSGGGVVEMDVGMTGEPVISFGFVGVQIVQDHMNLPSRMLADELVHEVEKLSTASTRIVAGLNLSGGNIQRCKQSGRSMPLVIMTESTQRPASGNLQVSLSPFQGLDMRLLIHRQDQGVVGRIQIKSNNVRRLGGKLRIGTDTPAAPSLQLNAPAPQHPPDVSCRNISQSFGQQGTIPNGIARRWRLIQLFENPSFHRSVIASRWARARSISQPVQSLASKAQPPLTDGGGSLPQLLGNGLRGLALSRRQYDSRSQDHPLFG